MNERIRALAHEPQVPLAEPARVVLAVREEHDERPLLAGREHDAGVERVVDRGGAFGPEPPERAPHQGLVGRRLRQPEHVLVERDESGLVGRPQPVEERLAGGAQRLDAVAGHAAAGVEDEQRVHRPRLGGLELDALPHAVVGELEVAGREAEDGLAAACHERVDVNGRGLAAELERLRLPERVRRERPERERQAGRFHSSVSRCSDSLCVSWSIALPTR